MRALGEALQAFLTSDAMSPFSSKYDDFLRGRAQLSPLETKGLKAFRNPDKGACNGCHLMYDTWNRPDGSLFTDYGYDAVSVPRNRAVAANANPNRYDLGLCERTQARVPSSDPQWCVRFRTPSLRNVAVRERFMHNGVFSKLRDAVAFSTPRVPRIPISGTHRALSSTTRRPSTGATSTSRRFRTIGPRGPFLRSTTTTSTPSSPSCKH
jgi:cytochrome c peroxidase